MAVVTWLAWKQTSAVFFLSGDQTGVCRENCLTSFEKFNASRSSNWDKFSAAPRNPLLGSASRKSMIRTQALAKFKTKASAGSTPTNLTDVRRSSETHSGVPYVHLCRRRFNPVRIFATENLKQYQHCSRLSFSRCIIATLCSYWIRVNCVIDVDGDSITLWGDHVGRHILLLAPTQSTSL